MDGSKKVAAEGHGGKKTLYRIIYDEQKNKILTGGYAGDEMMPSERELCGQYGVDRITVRRALNMLVDDGLIEKRAGIGSFVRLNAQCGGVWKGDSKNILFVMFNNTNDVSSNPSAFNSELFNAIEQECRQKNLSLFYSVMDGQSDLVSLANGNSFMGVLFVSFVPGRILDYCADSGAPAICLNSRHERLLSIVPEDERGSYEAAKYLFSEGHRNIGVLLGRREYYSTRERLRGFAAAMGEFGAEWIELQGDWTFDGARSAVLEMLDSPPPSGLPTAIYCFNDIMAIGAMDALKERGISVPRDISVMGFDNVRQSSHVFPRLTTVSVDVNAMARLAVDRLCALAGESSSAKYTILIPAALEKRQSVAPPKGRE